MEYKIGKCSSWRDRTLNFIKKIFKINKFKIGDRVFIYNHEVGIVESIIDTITYNIRYGGYLYCFNENDLIKLTEDQYGIIAHLLAQDTVARDRIYKLELEYEDIKNQLMAKDIAAHNRILRAEYNLEILKNRI